MRFKGRMRRLAESDLGRGVSLGLGILFLAALCGCSPPISQKVMKTVDPGRPFSVVIENPKAYIGSVVVWGGIIEEFIPGPEGTKLIVLQCPVDDRGVPQTEETYGEFAAHTPDSLNPRDFRKGMVINLAGMVDGVEEEKIGPERIPRPLIRIIEIHPMAGRGEGLRRR